MKNIIITGAASGIGKAAYEAINKGLYENIILLDKDEINVGCSKTKTYQADVSNEDEIRAIFKDLESKDILINYALNAAGVPGPNRPFSVTRMSDFKKIMDINFMGTMISMKYELKMMEKVGNGRIINLASVLARCGMTGSSSYAASKGAIVSASKCLAIEYAEKNIQINTLSPGAVDTNFLNLLKERMGGVESLNAIHPVKRVATAREIAPYITFILESDTSFLTGVDIPIDGGYSAQ